MRPCLLMLIPLAALLALPGCSPEPKAKKASAPEFRPLKDCKLLLEVVSPRAEYYRGEEGATITFRLRNVDMKRICIPEWMAKEEDNVRLLYARCDKGLEHVAKEDWRLCAPELKEPVPRIPLDLNPNNAALVGARMKFLKLPGVADGKGRSAYAVIGELNLKSVPLRSEPFVITVK